MAETILLVDDNTDVVTITRKILERKGYTVLSAYSGAEALALLSQHRPAVILLDIMMPEMDGFEVLVQVRNTPTSARIPVIFLTARTEDEEVLNGYRAGADYYIPKPFTTSQLLYGIKLVLGQIS